MLDQNTIENAQRCISQVADVEALVAAFYVKLFATHPEVRGMFADDMSAQIVSKVLRVLIWGLRVSQTP